MITAEAVQDVAGKLIEVGDTVVTVNGQTTGRVCEIAREDDDTAFVSIRPVYHSYGKGVWYAADQVFWVARSNEADKKKKKTSAPKAATAPSRPAPQATRSAPARKK